MTAHFPRLALLLGTAAMLAAAPVSLQFNPASGAFALKPAMALARGGNDDGPGHDANDDRGGDRNDDRNDDDSHDDGDDDSHDDDGTDDRNDDDSNDDDSHDGTDDDSNDDLNDDDSNDDGPGDDLNDDDSDDGLADDSDDDSVSTGPTKGKSLIALAGARKVAKVEVSRRGIEVTYRNGSKEQIEGRWYERKDKTGRTVEQRLATQADIDRLNALR
ncbi:hypothetical protein SAMN04488103_107109 [Gemmobacter aquatilis]|uniref:Uncharacterized protein n=1 Tax=Gemmobacter aquatilis TaxID=933059 RepID=A0A1H8J0G4_9RHOB|nr:hypothetical protein [Gemmobacter aquatilis]SEN74470.1 hypothetical protein SAMN04488103_107109 [Gemmobacter aquatilis]